MKKKISVLLLSAMVMTGIMAGCSQNTTGAEQNTDRTEDTEAAGSINEAGTSSLQSVAITPTEEIEELEDGLSVVRYEGNYGFGEFLAQGGAESDAGVTEYLMEQLSDNGLKILFGGNPFGCSTLSVAGADGGYLFGRNFDWNRSNGMIISSKPEEGYASVSTVNMDSIQSSGVDISKMPDNIQAIVGLYAPLDGMNEEGLTVSVNMIQDSDTIEQDTDRPDITTTTAVRLLLDQAANVEEAVALLEQYDLHASMGMMIHFALADADGNSVVVEYIDNEMIVTETPVVTNFYLTEGDKFGIGTEQSHERYEILRTMLEEQESMTEAAVRDALDSVSKDNFGEFESTEWSIVMNQNTKELTYFHRENYDNGYTIAVEQ